MEGRSPTCFMKLGCRRSTHASVQIRVQMRFGSSTIATMVTAAGAHSDLPMNRTADSRRAESPEAATSATRCSAALMRSLERQAVHRPNISTALPAGREGSMCQESPTLQRQANSSRLGRSPKMLQRYTYTANITGSKAAANKQQRHSSNT